MADSLKQMKFYSIYLIDTLGQVSPIVFFGYKKAKSRCPKWGHPKKKTKKNKKSVHVVGRGVYLYASA